MTAYANTSSNVKVAQKIKKKPNIGLPKLEAWNYDACIHHDTPRANCEYRLCGNDFFAHQRVSIAWLYAIKKGLLASSPGTGKAQPVDCKVLTPSGWRRIGDLVPGDEVYEPNRRITKIKAIHPQGLQPYYNITMTDKSKTQATPDHLWKVRRGSDGPFFICTTEQLREEIKTRPMLQLPPTFVPGVGHVAREIFAIQKPNGGAWAECVCIELESEKQLYLTDDYIVTHNTNVILGLLCLLKQQNEIPRRSLIIVNTPSVKQWQAEAARFAPGLKVAAIPGGTKKSERIETYGGSWDVLIIGFHMMLKDMDLLRKINPSALLTDDVDPLLNDSTKVHQAITELSEDLDRVVVSNASSVGTDLIQLHSSMKPIGGKYIWGPKAAFEDNFIQKEWERIKVGTTVTTDAQGRRVSKPKYVSKSKVRGVKNASVLKETLDPWYIRYTYDDISDVAMPEVAPVTTVWLTMHKEQRKKYDELRAGVLKMLENGEEKIKEVDSLQIFTFGAQICAGLPVLGEEDGPGKSVKFDWFCSQVRQEWSDEKVICFVRNKKAIAALKARLDKMGIGCAEVTGNKVGDERQAEITRFWEDENCRVIFCSAAGVRSLNLQCARIVCFLDIPSLNPESVHQAVGRARRAGGHDRVYPFFVMCEDTQEDKYEEVLQQRETISRWVWESEDHLLPKMSAREILQLILP